MLSALFAVVLAQLFILMMLYVRRITVERALVGAIESATARVKGKAGQRTQTMGTRERQVLELTSKQAEIKRIRRKSAATDAEIALRETIDYRIVHQIGEPTKGKEVFKAILTPNPHAEKAQVLTPALHKVEHVAIIVAENDTTAKRMLAAQYGDKGPLRLHSMTRELRS